MSDYPTTAEEIRAADIDAYILEAKSFLAQHDYVIHKDKSWRQLVERCRVAEALRTAAEERVASVEHWAQIELHNEIRDLMARCTFLYGVARAKGATADELSGGWTPAGINMPTERDTTIQCHCGTHPYIVHLNPNDDIRTHTRFICPDHGVVATSRTTWREQERDNVRHLKRVDP